MKDEKTKKRFALDIFKWWGTQAQEFIESVDIDGFENLIIVIKYLMEKELDPLIMNCGPIKEIKFDAKTTIEKIKIYETKSNLSKNKQ